MEQDKQRVVDMSSYEVKEKPVVQSLPQEEEGYVVKTYKGKRVGNVYTSEPPEINDENEDLSLRGTLFSTIVFVGGAILLWSCLLLMLFILRY